MIFQAFLFVIKTQHCEIFVNFICVKENSLLLIRLFSQSRCYNVKLQFTWILLHQLSKRLKVSLLYRSIRMINYQGNSFDFFEIFCWSVLLEYQTLHSKKLGIKSLPWIITFKRIRIAFILTSEVRNHLRYFISLAKTTIFFVFNFRKLRHYTSFSNRTVSHIQWILTLEMRKSMNTILFENVLNFF